MKLTDQEQSVIKAIYHINSNGVAPISEVVKALNYPKATTKKILSRLADKQVVTLHRHDWPQSLSPAERKHMVRLQDGLGNWHYFTAVSVREQNPGRKHVAGLSAKGQRQYEAILKSTKASGRYKGREKEVAARTAKKMAVNPTRRIKVRNRYVDLVIKGTAKKTKDGWQVGRKVFPQGRGTVQAKPHVYLDKSTGLVYTKRERNKTVIKAKRVVVLNKGKKRTRNISEGFYDASGIFHPIRAAADYSRDAAGEAGHKARRTKGKKKLAIKRKASATARHRSVVKGRKATTKRLAGRSIKKSAGLLGKRKKRNPSPESIRKEFAGRYTKDEKLIFPDGTPQGLAKLGQLVSIKTQAGTVKPVKGTAWLCSDTRGRLHIGTPTSGHVVFGGPAQDFGKVREVEYKERKPHLGYHNQTIFFHKLGEDTGVKPRLVTDGKGGAKFVGGAYQIRREGIVN